MDITLVRTQDGSLRPATDQDQDLMSKFKTGQGVRVSIVKLKDRSLQHHKLYFGGLLALVGVAVITIQKSSR